MTKVDSTTDRALTRQTLRSLSAGAALVASVLLFADAFRDAWRGSPWATFKSSVDAAEQRFANLTDATFLARVITVYVSSEPSEAWVSVNGSRQGTTPTAITFDCPRPDTALVIEVALPGYAPWRRETTCGAGKDRSFAVTLLRE